MNCPSCSGAIPDGGRFCPLCGTEVAQLTGPVTEPYARGSSPVSSTDLGEHGRFLPGTILARRYRIVGLLGRGGMGEVYRADDLKLGQAVALKLLPERMANDPKRLEYFHNEVRLARQVSHPNVCRVYDIGEVDGQHYLSMEYIDGEDLATLIRRIGRLPPDKGVDIARQLCAGLAAAHDRSVLHRDLKPANVMLDGRGRVRITDFGLAQLSNKQGDAGANAGTPAYMAPEQLTGREVSEQSDIYSLGLVLFEVFTGKPVFNADTPAEFARLRENSTPNAPSNLVSDIDPTVERVILQCLEKEPKDRPNSALAVSTALPGGDLLAAALAAGETPSPEMVAAAGEVGTMRPVLGGVLLGIVFVGLCAVALLAGRSTVVNLTSEILKPREVLLEDARDIVRLVDNGDAGDTAFGFGYEWNQLHYLDRNPTSRDWTSLSRGSLAGMYFWYRLSPKPLAPIHGLATKVTLTDPPLALPGMMSFRLDPAGRLLGFRAVPPDAESSQTRSTDFDFREFFALSPFQYDGFSPALQSTPDAMVAADQWSAWERTFESRIVRVEAATWQGHPVLFRIVYPEAERPDVIQHSQFRGGRPSFPINVPVPPEAFLMMDLICLIVYATAFLIARRNLRLGRGDRKGALKVGIYAFSLCGLSWLFGANHSTHFAQELASVWSVTILATFVATFVVFFYLAIEPYARRRWPEFLISWSRLLAGRFHDPRIGGDLLIGSVVAVSINVFCLASVLLANRLGLESADFRTLTNLDTLRGGRHLIALFFDVQLIWFVNCLVALLMLLLLRRLTRNDWITGAVFVVISVGMLNPGIRSVVFWAAIVIHSAAAYMAIRWGLVGGLTTFSLVGLLFACPVTADMQAWYSGGAVFALAIVGAVASFGFYTATGHSRRRIQEKSPGFLSLLG